MNWFDIILIVVGVIFLSIGVKVGLFRAVFMVAGMVIGLLLAAQISSPVAEELTDSVGSDSTTTVITYAIVLGVTFLVAQIIGQVLRKIGQLLFLGCILRKAVTLLLLGWVDSLGGAALGAATAILVGIGIIAIIARLAFLVPDDLPSVIGQVEVRDSIEDALVGSTLVPYYIDATDALPGNALGLIPGDFERALDELERKIDEKEAAEEQAAQS